MPKGRESGMPEAEIWQGFFSPADILDRLECDRPARVVEFGCGYGIFSVEAGRRAQVAVHAIDIDPLMVAATTAACRKAGRANVHVTERDFMADGTGLPDRSCDYAMVFNILHIDAPVALLREALRILRPGGRVGIIHWNVDPSTPRGPSMGIRPTPDQCRRWAEEAGFHFLRDEPGIGKWHWGLLLQAVFPPSRR